MDFDIMHGFPGRGTEPGKPLRVLVIGNSFSRSLIRELPQLMTAQNEYTLDLTNMFIGGCSLERHINEYETALADPEHKPYRIDRIAPGGVLEPDYMSILVGVNDVWHGIDYDWWATPEDLERSLVEIISETMAERPGVKIMLLEPYVLKECATDNTEEKPNKWDTFRREVAKRQEITKKIAEDFGVSFVPLQGRFDSASLSRGVKYLSADGVHPTPAGHELIARAWLEEFEKIK